MVPGWIVDSSGCFYLEKELDILKMCDNIIIQYMSK